MNLRHTEPGRTIDVRSEAGVPEHRERAALDVPRDLTFAATLADAELQQRD